MDFLKSRKLDKSGYRRSGMTPAQLRGSATQSGAGHPPKIKLERERTIA